MSCKSAPCLTVKTSAPTSSAIRAASLAISTECLARSDHSWYEILNVRLIAQVLVGNWQCLIHRQLARLLRGSFLRLLSWLSQWLLQFSLDGYVHLGLIFPTQFSRCVGGLN